MLSGDRLWRGVCFEGQFTEGTMSLGTFYCICTLNGVNGLSVLGGGGAEERIPNCSFDPEHSAHLKLQNAMSK